jgi:hypothetical protein
MRFRNIAGDVTHAYRRLGWLDGSLFLLHRAISRASGGRFRLHRYYFMAQPVATKPWLPGKRGASIEVREVAASDPLVRDFPRPSWAMPFRFAQGAVCLAALSNGACVGFLWMQLGPYREDEVRCRYVPLPKDQAAWDFDVYVHPAHRKGLVFLRLWDEANRYLAARGVRWSLSRVSAFSPGSMNSHARMGSYRLGSAVFVCLGSLQLCAATVAPRFSVSRHPDAIPSFVLNAAKAQFS